MLGGRPSLTFWVLHCGLQPCSTTIHSQLPKVIAIELKGILKTIESKLFTLQKKKMRHWKVKRHAQDSTTVSELELNSGLPHFILQPLGNDVSVTGSALNQVNLSRLAQYDMSCFILSSYNIRKLWAINLSRQVIFNSNEIYVRWRRIKL